MDQLFQFHATAAAASGRITLPFCEQIEVTAGSSLPPGGGYGSSRVNDFRYREILSIREAYTYVTGSYSKQTDTFQTATTAVVTGFSLLDIVTADRIVARLTSERSRESGEVSIVPIGSTFQNLRIAGRRIDAAESLRTRVFAEFEKFSDITGKAPERPSQAERERLERLEKIRPQLDSHLTEVLLLNQEKVDERLRKYFPHLGHREWKPQSHLSCSLVPELSPSIKEQATAGHMIAAGHTIYVKGFGIIRLAEMQISESRRRLTMLSVDLGCPFEGRVEACYAESNGSIWG